MEPTESAIIAGMKAAEGLGVNPVDVAPIVRAALAAVPDPVVLADKWDTETDVKMGEATNRVLSECADELRAFMRGADQ